MFPPNDSAWITYIKDAVPNNEYPCWVDIVGSVSYPAAYYYLHPPLDLSPTDAAFRMRLNGDPIGNNPNEYRLKEFVWGVVIRSDANAVLFTIYVNASGSTYNLQVRDSSSALIYNDPIALNSPPQPTDNVRVVDAGANFPCASPIVPDEDYFLDFTLPTDVFGAFNFATSTYRLCYFTSTQDNVINKEFVCGMIINPPVETPVLCVTKQIMSGPTTVCTGDIHSWFLLITMYNCGTVPVNNVVLTDTLNGSLVLTSAPVFIPNSGVSYDAGTRVVIWNAGTIGVGATVAFTINLTGYFTVPGHYILDSGTVTATDLTPTVFADHGILAYGHNQLTADKQIVSGPSSVKRCEISTWTFRITVSNTAATDIPNVVVYDLISSQFTIESGPILSPSKGTANVTGKEIIWTIDNLAGNSTETLLITVTGFFSSEGNIIFNSGSINNPCGQAVTFQDAGIKVLPIDIKEKIQVCGDIVNCKTNELLNGVSATVFDGNCAQIGKYLFDRHYCLPLPAGIYSVLFEKEGYSRKFLSLVLQSDADIGVNVDMAPKIAVSLSDAEGKPNADMDIFSGIICEKIDAEIVYSSITCLNSEAQVESLDDVVDSHSCTVLCESKLRLALNMEKNIVYKLSQTKHLKYLTQKVSLCYPLKRPARCANTECSVKVKCVNFCKEQNILYNIAYLRFNGYLIHEDDILVGGAVI